MKLKATGIPFGEGECEILKVDSDIVWKAALKEMQEKGVLDDMHKLVEDQNLGSLGREFLKTQLPGMLRSSFPPGLPDKTFNEYMEQLIDIIINGSD